MVATATMTSIRDIRPFTKSGILYYTSKACHPIRPQAAAIREEANLLLAECDYGRRSVA